MLQQGRSRVRDPMRWMHFFSLLDASSRARPRCLLSLEHQRVPEAEKYCFWGVERGRCVGLSTSSPSVSRLCRQYGVFNIAQPQRPPRSVEGIALLFYPLFSFVVAWPAKSERVTRGIGFVMFLYARTPTDRIQNRGKLLVGENIWIFGTASRIRQPLGTLWKWETFGTKPHTSEWHCCLAPHGSAYVPTGWFRILLPSMETKLFCLVFI
jgi:hypothetical protein